MLQCLFQTRSFLDAFLLGIELAACLAAPLVVILATVQTTRSVTDKYQSKEYKSIKKKFLSLWDLFLALSASGLIINFLIVGNVIVSSIIVAALALILAIVTVVSIRNQRRLEKVRSSSHPYLIAWCILIGLWLIIATFLIFMSYNPTC